MATTESSVVVALREVRRLELERQRREEEARVRAQDEEAARRGSIQYGQELSPMAWNTPAGEAPPESYVQPMRRTSEVVPLAHRANGFHEPHPYVNMPGPTTWEAPPPVQTSRSGAVFKTFLVTVILCAGGAAFGYIKLNREFEIKMDTLRREKIIADEARNEGVAERSKNEQAMKLKITELEGKLAKAVGQANAASAALNQATAVANAAMGSGKPAPLAARGKGLHKGRATRLAQIRAARAAAAAKQAEAPAPAPAKAPKVAKKKAISDDPLGGLRL